ncbi:MAG: glutaredoxin domain-containing protein [Spirochaetaceae bacterium]|jgi:glutaredoxin-like protein NrdH|nr:glutaredoxin domain-containing protein [Spirochaetaceae bacterium]
MFDTLEFHINEGIKKEKDLILLALTTCGFCKRAMAYLDAQDFKYRYFYADELDLEKKTALKQEFKDHFGNTLHFPTLIIDNKEFLVGFIQPAWEMELEQEKED